MSKKALNQIFVLHSVKFVCEALKEHGKKQDVNVYVLDDSSDFKFFLEDLKPQIVIARDEDVKGNIEAFLQQLEDFPTIMKVLWSRDERPELAEKFDKTIVEPISPMEVFDHLAGELESFALNQ